MSENMSIGYKLAWEALRLTGGETGAMDPDVLDFGVSDWVGYRAQPYGLIGVQFQSEYIRFQGMPLKWTEDETSIIASVMVETHYSSLRATGALLCDRELYYVHSDGEVQGILSTGEYSVANEVDTNTGEDAIEDMTAQIFGLKELPDISPWQRINGEMAQDISAVARNAPNDDPRVERLKQELEKILELEEEGEVSGLRVSTKGLKQLLGKLKLLDSEDLLGTINPEASVDRYIDYVEETEVDVEQE
jgi:hypothetical protein